MVVLVITSRCEDTPQLAYVSGDTRGTVSLSRGFDERSTKCSISDVNCRSVKNYMYFDDYLRNKYCIWGDCGLIYRRGIFK